MITATATATRRINVTTTARMKTGIVGGFNYVVGVGTKKLTVSSTEPVNPKEGDLWVEIA